MTSVDQIWHDYHRGLLSFIRGRVVDADLAEDLLQDVFVKVHSRLDTLVSADRVQSWLYQIARHTIIDYHRTRKSTEPLPDEVAQPPAQGDAEWQALRQCVLPMMSRLPEVYREALTLSDINGLPLKEVAERLNLSLPGAKSRVQRGRSKLRKVFLDCCLFRFDCQGKPIDWSPKPGCDPVSCKPHYS